MNQRLHLITFGVEDLGRSLDFYEKGLGWQRSPMGSGDLVLFPLGGITLALYPKNELAKDIGLDFEPSSFAGLTFSYNTGSKEEVDWVMEKVASLGAQIVKPAQNAFWGGYGGYFKDPDRYYLIEVAFNPFWEFDEDGHLRL
jgi:hypothetical protein